MAGDEKRGALTVANEKHGDLDFGVTCRRFKNWLSKQPLPTLQDAAWTAVIGFAASHYLGMMSHSIIRKLFIDFRNPPPSPQSLFLSRCGGYRPLVESFLAYGPFEKGNNIAIMSACNASISFVMKNIRGKEDLQTVMAAGFGYGVVISLVTGMRGPDHVLAVGATCAIMNVGMHKAGIKGFPIPNWKDIINHKEKMQTPQQWQEQTKNLQEQYQKKRAEREQKEREERERLERLMQEMQRQLQEMQRQLQQHPRSPGGGN